MEEKQLLDKEYNKRQKDFLNKLKQKGFKDAKAYPRSVPVYTSITDKELLIVK